MERQQRRPRTNLAVRLYYGSGSIAFGVKDNAFAYFLLIYYNQVLGLSATAAGAALMIALVWDAISDPIIGSVSDNWHSRWGRRHPFMYASAIPFALGFYLLWNPPDGLSQQGLFWYMLIGAVGVRTVLTLYEVPSSSLVPELTEDYDERTALISFRFFFGWYAGLSMAALAYTVFLAATPEYPNGVLNPDGYFGYSVVGAIAIGVSILISAAGTHPFITRLRQPPPKRPFVLRQTFGEMLQTLSNRSFLSLFLGALFLAGGMGLTAALQIYISTYFWEFTSEQIGTIVLFQFFSALIAPVLAPVLTRRFDKKATAMGLAIFAIVFGAAPIVLRLLGWFVENGHPWLLPMMRGHAMIEVTVFIMVSIVLTSMVADVAEENEIRNGRREEGLFFAARNFALKATSGIGVFLAGLTLDAVGFPEDAMPGAVDPDVIFRLGVVFGPLLMCLYLVSVVFIAGYKITRQGHESNLTTLAGGTMPDPEEPA